MGLFDKGNDQPLPTPDPSGLIDRQLGANRLDQFTPFGSLTFSGPNRSRADLSLAPGLQQSFDARTGLSNAAMARALLGIDALPQSRAGGDFSGDARRVEQATFDRGRGLLDPIFELDERRMRQRLANQGLPMGSEAFTGEFDRFDTRRDNAFTNLALDAVGAGRAEQSRLFGLESAARSQELQQLATLLGAGNSFSPQIPGLGDFLPPAAVDILGPEQLAQNANLANFQNREKKNSALMSGLFALGSTALGMPPQVGASVGGLFA